MLYDEVVEVAERVVLKDAKCRLDKKRVVKVVTGTTGEEVSVKKTQCECSNLFCSKYTSREYFSVNDPKDPSIKGMSQDYTSLLCHEEL